MSGSRVRRKIMTARVLASFEAEGKNAQGNCPKFVDESRAPDDLNLIACFWGYLFRNGNARILKEFIIRPYS